MRKNKILNYKKIRNNPSQFLSLTGLSVEEFDLLSQDFSVEFQEYVTCYTYYGKPRLRLYKPRKTSTLPSIEEKLFFILIFLKTNPLQEHHASNFGITQPKANMLIHLLLPLLRKTLRHLGELPERKASRLLEILKEQTDVLLDGTERPIQRPSDYELADEHYSGKKNA